MKIVCGCAFLASLQSLHHRKDLVKEESRKCNICLSFCLAQKAGFGWVLKRNLLARGREWEHGKQKATLWALLSSHPAAVIQGNRPLPRLPSLGWGVLELKVGFPDLFWELLEGQTGGGAWRGFVKLKLAVCQWSDPTPIQLPAGEPSVIQDLDVRHSHWGMTDAGWGKDCDSASGILRERQVLGHEQEKVPEASIVVIGPCLTPATPHCLTSHANLSVWCIALNQASPTVRPLVGMARLTS